MFSASDIHQYKSVHFCSGKYAVIRTFTQGYKQLQLSVNPRTLQTHIEPRIQAEEHACTASPYATLLTRNNMSPYPLQNDGTVHIHKGITLTTDLCPSSKSGFEKGLYEAMISRFPNPVPVTLFITGRWIKKHPDAFHQFTQWEKEEKLVITWGNHTYTHPYHPKEALSKNFSLSKGYDLEEDTLKLEKLLIAKGITPSVFFRFPGLVSNQKAMQIIRDLGLITIGSDTWIAKGQKVKEGSIILLHGNKNEPKGVEMFLEILRKGNIKKLNSLDKVLP